MANRLNTDEEGAPTAKRILQAAAKPIHQQMKANASSDPKYRYVWLYKCRAKPVTETYSTKEGDKVTRQTGEVEWTAIKRTHDVHYQAVADEGENSFSAEDAATFLTSVYEPDFTPSGT